MKSSKKEILGFNKGMILQCIVLYAGICAGLFISRYCFVLVGGFTVLTALFGKIEYSYHQLLFCLPFSMIYKLSPASISMFTYVMLIVGIILFFRASRMNGVPLLLIAIFAVYAFVGMGSNYTAVIKIAMGMLLFYIFIRKIAPSDYKNQIMAFTSGMFGSSLIGLMKGSWAYLDQFYSDMNDIYIDGVREIRFSGLYLDPNYYSISAIFAIALCMMLFFRKDGNRAVLAGLTVVLTIFGLMSYSKMFLLAFVFVVLINILYSLNSAKNRLITIVAFVLGGILVYKWMQSSSYFSVMLDRLAGGDVSTGRFGIWKSYLSYIWSSPMTLFFGDGLGAGYYKGVAPHNTYIESVYFLGLLGSVVYLVTLCSVFASKKMCIKRKKMNYTLLLVFFIMIATLGCLTINDLMFYCMLLYIYLNTDMKKGVYTK